MKFPISLLAWSGLVPAAALAAAEPAVVLSEFIYEDGPYPQIHATTLAETPSGLVAAWFGGTREGHPDVAIRLSRQEADGRWTESVAVVDGVQHARPDGTVVRHPCWNPVLFRSADGPLLLFAKVGPSPREWWGVLTVSRDDGRTWDSPRRLPEGILGPVKNKPVQLPDGSILCPSSEETRLPDGRESWTIHFERTRDLGRSWERTLPLHNGLAVQAIQPSLLFLGGERWLALGRSRQDRVFQVRSEDGGRTWGEVGLGTLPNNNSGTDAVTLADGSHLIVYNHVGGTPGKWGGKRTPLNVASSRDGVAWEAAAVLESEPGEYSYPAVIQTRDGRVHVTYTWNRKKVKHVVLDPARFRLRPITDGRWPEGE
jgi:predicted neuraminidase